MKENSYKKIDTPNGDACPLQVHSSCMRTPSLLTRSSLTPMSEKKIVSYVPSRGKKAIPLTNPSWSSFESSSRDLPLVSGRRRVENIPVSMKKANSSRLGRAGIRNGLYRSK
jgi:hypothetical protein